MRYASVVCVEYIGFFPGGRTCQGSMLAILYSGMSRPGAIVGDEICDDDGRSRLPNYVNP